MPTANAHITWDLIPGSTGYLIEYRLSSTTTWIVPTFPANPTLNGFYDLTINQNAYYDYRITSNGERCSPNSRTGQLFAPSGACCPVGYTLSVDGTFCFKVETTAATPPSVSENTIASPFFNYGAYGSVIYNSGYSIDGYGPFTLISMSNAFWNNSALSTTAGPNNRTALWSTTLDVNQDVGFTTCITVPETKTYYVGCFADNYIRISLDGTPVVVMNPTTMGAYYNVNGYPGIGNSVTFYLWHIYPIVLTAGDHVINIIGHNDSGPAGMGAEVYNATPSELQAATSYASLGSKLLFSTKDYFGQPVQIGSGGIGYTCPDPYNLILCDGPAYCTRTLKLPTEAC